MLLTLEGLEKQNLGYTYEWSCWSWGLVCHLLLPLSVCRYFWADACQGANDEGLRKGSVTSQFGYLLQSGH